MENINLTKEDWDIILECVGDKLLAVLEERLHAPYKLQDELRQNTPDNNIHIELNDGVKKVQEYLNRDKVLLAQSDRLKAVHDKVIIICDKNHEGERKK